MAQQTGNRWKAAELVEAFASDAHVMGDFVRASEHYEEARGLYQELDSPHGVFRVVTGIADAHRDQGKHQESLAAAQETVSIAERLRDPDFMRSALLATALSYDALGDYDNAEKVLQRAQTIGPESPDVLGTLSWHNNEAGAYADALEAAGRALELEPDMAWVMFNQALALLATGNHAAAMDAYRRAAGSSRPDYDATQDLEALKRVIAREQGIPGADEAIELLREVVAGRQRGPAGSAG
jgi:tetratricopeptide (TPR) repeat protein